MTWFCIHPILLLSFSLLLTLLDGNRIYKSWWDQKSLKRGLGLAGADGPWNSSQWYSQFLPPSDSPWLKLCLYKLMISNMSCINWSNVFPSFNTLYLAKNILCLITLSHWLKFQFKDMQSCADVLQNIANTGYSNKK